MGRLNGIAASASALGAAFMLAIPTGLTIGHMNNPKVHTFIHPVTSCEYIYTISSDLIASEDGKGDHLGCRAPYMGSE